MNSKKGISVVIPNYNGAGLLPEIIPALYEALAQVNLPHEVIISDDASVDGSTAYLRENFPRIILIENKINAGFSITINKGIFAAQYELVLLLNSDVKLTPGYFEKLLPYFDAADTFGVMSRIIGWDDDQIQDGGKYPAFHGVKIKTSGNYIPLDPQEKRLLCSMYLSGANALVSREKLIALGGFDEIFTPFYSEDFELSLRAWRSGWKCYYEHGAVCRHRTSTTIKQKSSKVFIKKIYNRNKMFLHAIHLEPAQRFLWHLQLIPETLLYILTGRLWFLSSLRMYLSSRAAIKASRKKFAETATTTHPIMTTDSVIKNILHSLSQIPIKRF